MATTSTLPNNSSKQELTQGTESKQENGKLPAGNKHDVLQELAMKSMGKGPSEGGETGAYEPPPDIGGPKRTRGSGGR